MGIIHSIDPLDGLSIEESVRIREKKRYPVGVEDILAFSYATSKS